MKNGIQIIDIGTRLIASGILGFSAFLKLTAAPATVFIFQKLGMEPSGRYGVAVLEIITLILILFPRTAWRGAILGCMLMFGAICMHLTMAQFSILGDNGLMFASAIVVFACCISVLVFHKSELEAELN